VPAHTAAETIVAHGCSIVLRRFEGPLAGELFLHCQPPAGSVDARTQAAAIYRAMLTALQGEGATFASVVSETVFLRSLRTTAQPVREARHAMLHEHGCAAHRPATTYIEQPPLDEQACLEVSLHAIVSRADGAMRCDAIEVTQSPAAACGCDECARAHGLRVRVGTDETRLHAAGLCGARGASAYQQTLGMLELAERLLQQAGMEFSDVVRAWIYMRDIDRDYADLNRARREFFAARGIDPVPASTGIGGGPVAEGHDLCLGVYAVKTDGSRAARTVMTSPTLNEAPQYGADFVRGMRVQEANRTALYVSGTASIDEHGLTAHIGDFDAQADRMFVNIAALLQRQGATFKDVVHAITYLKHPADAPRLRQKIRDAGFEGFPHALVVAPICRPDLLCETEALAVLKRD
jgi:enamine deaminase RidA (YjgF/YER057c/UK114 family)